jgi:hypothetical protein
LTPNSGAGPVGKQPNPETGDFNRVGLKSQRAVLSRNCSRVEDPAEFVRQSRIEHIGVRRPGLSSCQEFYECCWSVASLTESPDCKLHHKTESPMKGAQLFLRSRMSWPSVYIYIYICSRFITALIIYTSLSHIRTIAGPHSLNTSGRGYCLAVALRHIPGNSGHIIGRHRGSDVIFSILGACALYCFVASSRLIWLSQMHLIDCCS